MKSRSIPKRRTKPKTNKKQLINKLVILIQLRIAASWNQDQLSEYTEESWFWDQAGTFGTLPYLSYGLEKPSVAFEMLFPPSDKYLANLINTAKHDYLNGGIFVLYICQVAN